MLKVLNKTSKLVSEKDEVFVNLYNQVEDKNFKSKKTFCLLLHHLLT